MKLGMFMMPCHDPRRDVHQALLEDVGQAVLADRLGYDEFWVGEHYSAPSEPVTDPFTFLANLIARTKRMKLCTGVINLPQQHPAVVAAHAALLDHLSEGRMMFGVSSGGLPSDFELFKLTDPRTRGEMLHEAADMIVKIWSQDGPYDIKGKYWDVTLKDFVVPELGIGTILKPYQKPHPPMAVSAVSPFSYSVKHAGKKGWNFISAHFCTRANIKSHWEAYRQGCEEAGRTPDPSAWRVARVIHVDRDAGAAKAFVDDADGPVRFFWSYLLGVLGRSKMLPLLKTDPAMPDSAVDVDYAIREFTLVGDPRSVANQIQGLREEVGDFRMIVQLALELVRRTEIEASMRLLSGEVIPLLRA